MPKSEAIRDIESLSAKGSLSTADMKALSDHLNELKKSKDEISEAVDILPALQKYKAEHSLVNLQKVCVEIADLCRAVYASTRNDEERAVYKHMLDRLNR